MRKHSDSTGSREKENKEDTHRGIEHRNGICKQSKKKSELLVLQRINNTLVNTLSLHDVLQTITDGMIDTFGFAGSIIFTNDERHNCLVLKALSYNSKIVARVEKLTGYSLKDHRFSIDKDEIYKRLYNDRQPIMTTDIAGLLARLTGHEATKKLASAISRLLRLKSTLLIPLTRNDGLLGILVVASRRSMNQEDLAHVQAFADQSSIAIERAKLIEDERQKTMELSALHTTLLEVTSRTDTPQLLKTIIEKAAELLKADAGCIYLYDEIKDRLILHTASGYLEKYINIELEPGEGMAGKVFNSGEPLIIDDYRFWEGRASVFETHRPFTAVMELPLKWHGEIPGILAITADNERRTFTKDDIWLAMLFADQAAIAVANARLLDKAQKNAIDLENKVRDMQLVNRLSQIVSSSLDLNHILNTAVEQTATFFGVDHSGILLFNRAQTYGRVAAEYPHSGSADIQYPVKGNPVLGRIIRDRKPLVIEDTWNNPLMIAVRDTLHSLDIRSMLIVPLIVEHRVVGSIGLDSIGKKRKFSTEEITLARIIANQVAIAIGNANLYKKLMDSEERFKDVTDNIGDWIWEIDTEGCYTYSNPPVKRVLGYAPGEVLGKYFYDFFHPDYSDIQKAAAVKAFLIKGEAISNFINRNVHRDGHTVILETSGVPVLDPDGRLTGYRGVHRDITARLKAEEELRNSEERYRLLVQSIDDLIFSVDREGRFYTAGGHALKKLNLSPEDITGKTLSDIFPGEEVEKYKLYCNRVFDSGISFTYEHELLFSGKRIINQTTAYPICNADGEVVLAGVISRDITRQRRLEEQLRQAQKMETIGTLAGGIAHDFNNILGGIMGYASFIESQLSADNPLYSDVQTIIQSVRRASDLTAQLLAFTRGGHYAMYPVNLNDTVDEVVKLLSRTIDKSISIKAYPGAELSAIEGNASQLQQMLLNLCLNARDAMIGGGILTIETANVTLNEKYTSMHLNVKPGNYVLLEVSDTGIGMNSETQAHIFEPFFTTKEERSSEKHSGLGLAMIYGIVHGHRGTINVYSEPGKGTAFKIYLPATERIPVKKNVKQYGVTGGGETILVADDEDTIRFMIKRLLTKAGYTILLAENGVEAVNLYRQHRDEISLIILDMIMPEMNGEKAYELISGINPDVKVLLSSGYSQNGQANAILKKGIKGFLQKPYDLNQILHQIRNVLDEKSREKGN